MLILSDSVESHCNHYEQTTMTTLLKLLCLSLAAVSLVLADEKQDEPPTELKIEVLNEVTCERKSRRHDQVSMHYTGSIFNGEKFDSSHDRNEPFNFQLGIGQVIKGWEQGLLDMCPGEKRKLTIPPSLAYGDIGAGDAIPPGSTLVFEVELLKAQDGPVPENVFKQIDTDNDQLLTQEEVSKYLVEQAAKHDEKVEPESEEHRNVLKTIFEHEDKDRDGVISHDEFSGPKHDEL